MATGETGFDDVTFDLICVRCHSPRAGRDYDVRDAKNAGINDVASLFGEVMAPSQVRLWGSVIGSRSVVSSIPSSRRRHPGVAGSARWCQQGHMLANPGAACAGLY